MKLSRTFIFLLCLSSGITVYAQNPVPYQEFKTLSLLSVILNQCMDNQKVNEEKEVWTPFTISYGNFLVNKDNINQTDIAKIFANNAIAIASTYGDTIPNDVCEEALNKTQALAQSWNKKQSSNVVQSDAGNPIS